MFRRTAAERGLWRRWFGNGQSVEISWPSSSFGIRVVYHSDDVGTGRLLWIGLIFAQIFLPLGVSGDEWDFGDEPNWGIELSRQHGIVLSWKHWRKFWRWPFHRVQLGWEYRGHSGGWMPTLLGLGEVRKRRRHRAEEVHPYSYRLRPGEVQRCNATVYEERVIETRNILRWFGWPKRVTRFIQVEFDREMGEQAGSWKGGTVACGYQAQKGEPVLAALRRMESERKL